MDDASRVAPYASWAHNEVSDAGIGGAVKIIWHAMIVSSFIAACVIFPAAGGKVWAASYTTNFPLTENPLSENGHWINGKANGLDWADVSTTPGLAFGTESGSSGYDDSTAILAGSWGPDQTVQATVHTVNQNDNIWEEVEIRLRSAISARSNTGYEINFRCSKTSNAYSQIVRWNGPLGSFTYLNTAGGSQYGVKGGDGVKATIIGNVITVYINGVQILQATDNTFTTGSPGMGFFLQGGGAGNNGDYGFSSFTASDGLAPDTHPPSPPRNLRIR
jgi:hypothetical protein